MMLADGTHIVDVPHTRHLIGGIRRAQGHQYLWQLPPPPAGHGSFGGLSAHVDVALVCGGIHGLFKKKIDPWT